MTKVLLTGGSGFIAAHLLEQLLEKDYAVVTTVRSESKAQKIRDAFPDKAKDGKLEVVIVPDIAQPSAFDEVAKTPGLDAVLHTASPFHFNITDPKKDLIDPALIGTTGILKALHASAPSVKRVVITSSFASILDEDKFKDPSTTFTEKSWNPITIDDINRSPASAYRASKTLAERAAWDFVAEQKPSFDLVTVCPPLVLGPVSKHLATLESINTSNERVVNMLRGEWKEGIPTCMPVPLWIDVRDAARAHVRGLEEPSAGGKRLFATAGWFTHREFASIVRSNFPEFADQVPGPEVAGGDLAPKDQIFKINTDETNKLLGIEWISLEKSLVDLVRSLKELGI
ncbi:hypothetical protein FZEAL_4135 [Fusarium zealandicum]|uniref:NAD-dependent epimerase/dehydratase domain-containing protein n=1 Tax=Fusarium zealandicum TaxID=1053134 RepID=A0A8H4UM91_9HYPO|nr:hypothetical protein FZEAL_4135 [Fusarium zealandicum]